MTQDQLDAITERGREFCRELEKRGIACALLPAEDDGMEAVDITLVDQPNTGFFIGETCYMLTRFDGNANMETLHETTNAMDMLNHVDMLLAGAITHN